MKVSKKNLPLEKRKGYEIVQKKLDECNAMLRTLDLSFLDNKPAPNQDNDKS
ncbi:hypothetical protein FHS68_001049 [Dyadobacter arcticus]|uniref:Uncharacterized protein n=1 Tax=Dyadobacter arcticus TaxID=1078754 RepID=A0ABX0UFV9_9BACT|nr:hypothetical protein [Dyadobacter arcticus]